MKLFCLFIILMSYVEMQMAGPAYPASPPYNSGGYLQGQAYSSSNSYNTGPSAVGQEYYSNNAAAPYNSEQAYFPSGQGQSSDGQAYYHGSVGGTYNSAAQAHSSGSAGSSYNPGQSSNSAGALSNAGQILDIIIPQVSLEDFEYMPTNDGYRFSYELADGTKREEVGFIMNPGGDNPDLAVVKPSGDGKSITRPRGMVKSRKLSPKSLQSLAG